MKCVSILSNVFVGPDPRIDEDFEYLKGLKITAVLSLQTDEDRREGGIAYERTTARQAGLKFSNVPVTDFSPADLQLRLKDCVTALEGMLDDGETVFVHCTAGVSRSPTVVAAYLHWCLGWELDQAVAYLQARSKCSPDADAIREAGRRAKDKGH